MPVLMKLPAQFLQLSLVARLSPSLMKQLLEADFHLIPESHAASLP